jgi:hypothetical protein
MSGAPETKKKVLRDRKGGVYPSVAPLALSADIRLARDKHSSLFGPFISYEFFNIRLSPVVLFKDFLRNIQMRTVSWSVCSG